MSDSVADEKKEEVELKSSKDDLSKPTETSPVPEPEIIPRKRLPSVRPVTYEPEEINKAGVAFVKYTLFAVNFCLMILGLAILVVGGLIVSNSDLREVREAFEAVSALQPAAILVMVVGAFLMFVGFLGCCGTAAQNYCMLVTYTGIIIVLTIIEIAGMGLAFTLTQSSTLQTRLRASLYLSIKEQDHQTAKDQNFLDFVQVTFKCCGANGPDDYTDTRRPIPPSCFRRTAPDRYERSDRGCASSIVDSFAENGLTLALIALATVIAKIIAILSAILQIRNLRNQDVGSSVA